MKITEYPKLQDDKKRKHEQFLIKVLGYISLISLSMALGYGITGLLMRLFNILE